MIIDSHVHIGGPPAEGEPDKFAKFMDKNKIDKAIVFRYFYNKPTLQATSSYSLPQRNIQNTTSALLGLTQTKKQQ